MSYSQGTMANAMNSNGLTPDGNVDRSLTPINDIPPEVALFRDCFDEGMYLDQICERLNITPSRAEDLRQQLMISYGRYIDAIRTREAAPTAKVKNGSISVKKGAIDKLGLRDTFALDSFIHFEAQAKKIVASVIPFPVFKIQEAASEAEILSALERCYKFGLYDNEIKAQMGGITAPKLEEWRRKLIEARHELFVSKGKHEGHASIKVTKLGFTISATRISSLGLQQAFPEGATVSLEKGPDDTLVLSCEVTQATA